MLAVLQRFHKHISKSTLSSPSISLLSCHYLELQQTNFKEGKPLKLRN